MEGFGLQTLEVLAALEVMVVFAAFSQYISSLLPEEACKEAISEKNFRSSRQNSLSKYSQLAGYFDHKRLHVHATEYPEAGKRALYLTVQKPSLQGQRPLG